MTKIISNCITLFSLATTSNIIIASSYCANWDITVPKGHLNLVEASGIALGDDQVSLYHIEDSGNKPKVHVTDLAGLTIRRVNIKNAKNKDWEALAIGACPTNPERCLYIADFGDNRKKRKSYHIYIVKESKLKATSAKAKSLKFTYSDGKSHNAEGASMHPNGDLFLFTKGDTTMVFRIPKADLAKNKTIAQLMGSLPVETSTGADIHPMGKRTPILDYIGATEFQVDLLNKSSYKNAPATKISLRTQPQQEAIMYKSPKEILFTSEKVKNFIGRVPCKPRK